MRVGSAEAVVGRISLTGELGYEIVVPAERHRAPVRGAARGRAPHGLRLVGDRALDSLRLEKGYGIWSAEFRQDVTPGHVRARPVRRLRQGRLHRAARPRSGSASAAPRGGSSCCAVDAADADASKEDGIWLDGRLVGAVTSGAYGHHVGASLALAYVDAAVLDARPDLTIDILGEPRPARILPELPYDPAGARLRA